MRRAGRPKRALVNFKGVDYEMNLAVCQNALVHRQVAGEFDSMESLAQAVRHSRSTVTRFFGGRQTSLAVALAILSKLKLAFDDAFTRCEVDSDSR
jgi:hypothetical protein